MPRTVSTRLPTGKASRRMGAMANMDRYVCADGGGKTDMDPLHAY